MNRVKTSISSQSSRMCLFLACLLATAACTAHRNQFGPSWPLPSVPAQAPFVMAIAPFREVTPSAESEAKAEQERSAAILASLIGSEVVKIIQATGEPPVEPKQAAALAQSMGADGIVWGQVSLQEGKLSFQRYFHTRSGWDIAGSWFTTTYELADPGQRAARDKEVRSYMQFVLYGVNLAFMLNNQPEQSRRVLEVLRPGQEPDDFATRNQGLVLRRWGMQARLLRDGKGTEDSYRSALAWVDEQRKLHAGDPDYRASSYDAQEAFFSIGVARGFLLQGRPQDVVPLLSGILERMPDDMGSRELLGRALLALGEYERAAQVLEPVTRVGYYPVATRMYAAAITGKPDAAARTREAFSTLFSKSTGNPELKLMPYLASAGAERAELSAFVTSEPSGTWPVALARFLLGEIDEAALWTATKHPEPKAEREGRCWVHYALGEAELAGVMPGRTGVPDQETARRHFEAAIATHSFASDAYHLADFQLEQLRRTGS